MSDARTSILEQIRHANGRGGVIEDAQTEWSHLQREYHVRSELTRPEVLHLFEDRLLDYDATVSHTTPSGIVATLAQVLAEAKVQTVGIADGFDRHLLPEGFAFVVDEQLSPSALDALDAVLTMCTLAIAETGTLVLQAGNVQGRRALTLIPDVHLCLVDTAQVLATVPEALRALAKSATLPTTFVSGPSATADIEMTRIKGVHGPRFLHVILVEDETTQTEGER